jgi:anti-sigma regulatory factor (Ser/Thr protein kinase)
MIFFHGARVSPDTFKLCVNPEWKYIRPVREFIRGMSSARCGSGDIAYDISFITSELLENAVKYAAGGPVSMEYSIDDNTAEISVENRVDESNIDNFKRMLVSLSQQTAEQQYSIKFESPSFWENERGAMGLIMIHERCAGKIRFDYRNCTLRITCTVSTGGTP